MQFAAKGVSCTICNRYLPVEWVETQCNSICDSQTRPFWQQDRLSKTEEQLICVIYTVVLTYVCRSNAPGKKVLSAFAVLLAAAATAAQQSLSANTQQQALTGTRTTTPSPLPTPTPSLTTTVAAIYMQRKVQKAKGKVKNKSKKTLTISCSSRIKCKCKQQLASIVKSKVWEVCPAPTPASSCCSPCLLPELMM